MRKVFLLLLAISISSSIFAQSRAILLRETFDSNSLPEGWTTSDTGADNWVVSETNKAGGEANELKLNATPSAVGITRIITEAVDLTGLSSVVISFRHYFDKKGAGGSIGIATSSNNGTTWSQAWTKTYSETSQYSVVESVSTPDMGKNNVRFCIYYQGNTSNINGWYFDELEIMVIENIDAKAESIDVPTLIPAGNTDIVFSVQNAGLDNITSFEANYQVKGLNVSETFNTDIAQFGVEQFTFETPAYLSPGEYNLSINITSVNGEQDQNTVNNISQKNITVAIGGTQRIPMIEHFSSSTCASCVPLNEVMVGLEAANTGKYTYTKYAMNWPSPGDPYYISDAGVRRDYYSVSSVPHIVLDGISNGYIALTQEDLDAAYNSPAFIDIKGAFNTNGDEINVMLDLTSYINFSNLKLFVTVNEKTTHDNALYNGETDFHHIMMYMLSGPQGSNISMNAGESQRFEFSYDMSKTHAEEIDDLEVAVWVQNLNTKEVFNSQYLYEYTDHPYPAQNLTLTENRKNIEVSWEAPETGTPTGYNLYINRELVLENTTVTSYTIENAQGYQGVEVVALYADGKKSVSVIERVGESLVENEIVLGIYPNPVDNNLYINTTENVREVSIYNILSVRVYQENNLSGSSIDVSDLNEGVYIIRVSTDNGNVTKRFIKQ